MATPLVKVPLSLIDCKVTFDNDTSTYLDFGVSSETLQSIDDVEVTAYNLCNPNVQFSTFFLDPACEDPSVITDIVPFIIFSNCTTFLDTVSGFNDVSARATITFDRGYQSITGTIVHKDSLGSVIESTELIDFVVHDFTASADDTFDFDFTVTDRCGNQYQFTYTLTIINDGGGNATCTGLGGSVSPSVTKLYTAYTKFTNDTVNSYYVFQTNSFGITNDPDVKLQMLDGVYGITFKVTYTNTDLETKTVEGTEGILVDCDLKCCVLDYIANNITDLSISYDVYMLYDALRNASNCSVANMCKVYDTLTKILNANECSC